ncbi:hypothetical protein X759_07590 [Mesorhizobium sp. LSHC420B00]|nr:hypothetical protein X759_07590 [Mesorhizobium sp. LSHC420B00]
MTAAIWQITLGKRALFCPGADMFAAAIGMKTTKQADNQGGDKT